MPTDECGINGCRRSFAEEGWTTAQKVEHAYIVHGIPRSVARKNQEKP